MRPQVGVKPVALEQFPMGALLDNAPAIHHHKSVHELQRGKAMRDSDHGLPVHEFREHMTASAKPTRNNAANKPFAWRTKYQ